MVSNGKECKPSTAANRACNRGLRFLQNCSASCTSLQCLGTRPGCFSRPLTRRGFELLLFKSPWLMDGKVPSIFQSNNKHSSSGFWLPAEAHTWRKHKHTRLLSEDLDFLGVFIHRRFHSNQTLSCALYEHPSSWYQKSWPAEWGRERNRLATASDSPVPSTGSATDFSLPKSIKPQRNTHTPNPTSTRHPESQRVRRFQKDKLAQHPHFTDEDTEAQRG